MSEGAGQSDTVPGDEGSGDPEATFTAVDWDTRTGRSRLIELPTVVFGVLFGGLIGSYLYDLLFVPDGLVLIGPFSPGPLDWLVLLGVVVVIGFVVVPLLQEPTLARTVWSEIRAHPFGQAGFTFIVGALGVGVGGPFILGDPATAHLPFTQPDPNLPTSGLPPPFLGGVPLDSVLYCSGTVSDGQCHGDIAHPLGTTPSGRDVLTLVVGGFRVAMQVAILTSVLLVPLGTLAGATAAFYGGRTDAVIRRIADTFQVVPVVIVYLFVRALIGPRLWLLILMLGVLGWGQVAREVRAEALGLREAGYVRASLDAGATPFDTVRHHLIPNVTHVAVGALATQVPKLIVIEVTLAYIGLVQTQTPSWGFVIVAAIDDPNLAATVTTVTPLRLWWMLVFPLVALIGTVASIAVVADTLEDALDPETASG